MTADLRPVLTHHGGRDTLAPRAQSERFRDRGRALGCHVELDVVAGAGHVWLTLPLDVIRCAAWFESRLRPR